MIGRTGSIPAEIRSLHVKDPQLYLRHIESLAVVDLGRP